MTFRNAIREAVAANRSEKVVPAAAKPRTFKPRQRKPKPPAGVDALNRIPWLAARAARHLAIQRSLPPRPTDVTDLHPDHIVRTRGRAAIRGCAAIVAAVRKEFGASYAVADDGSVYYQTPGRAMLLEGRADLEFLSPLIDPYVREGHPPSCAFGDGRDAVTLLEPGNTLACPEHAGLSDEEPRVTYERVLPNVQDQVRQHIKRWTHGS